MKRVIETLLLSTATLALPARAADFNGDGFDDVVVMADQEQTGSPGARFPAIHVLYGSAAGLAVGGNQFLVEPATDDVDPGAFSAFANTFACGDFDGDGFTDLAVGAKQARVDGVEDAGAVYEYRGSVSGLTFRRLIHQNKSGITDHCERRDFFSESLAAGDFDGDGRDDLAIGVDEKIDGKKSAGAVHVIYGSKHGLGTHDELWHQNRRGVKDKCEKFDAFGEKLAAGDVNGDGIDDLVVLVIGEVRQHAGEEIGRAIAVLFGDDDGLSASGDVIFDIRDCDPGLDLTTHDASFGDAIAVGDFDGDGDGDLAIGAPFQGPSTDALNGAIYFVPTIGGKPQPASAQVFESPEKAQLGFCLAVGDFSGDGRDDLAVGAPIHAVSMQQFAGVVFEFHGSPQGLVMNSPTLWSQSTGNIPGTSAAFDLFGRGVATGDFDNDGRADVAIGVPHEDVGGAQDAGVVQTIYGVQNVGLTDAGAQSFSQNDLGVGQVSEVAENFGQNTGS